MPAAAHAQFTATPFSDPATGERYHIEAVARLVESVAAVRDRKRIARHARHRGSTPSPTSASQQKRIGELRIVLRPAPQAQVPHQLSADELQRACRRVHRDFVFNGIRYGVNLPVTTDLSWKTWHLGYEYDFLYRDRWFVGFVLQAKATDIQANLQALDRHRIRARAGAHSDNRRHRARLRGAEHLDHRRALDVLQDSASIDERYQAHYFDFDLYGTVNFNDYVGAQLGYRSLDLGYIFDRRPGRLQGEGDLLRRSRPLLTCPNAEREYEIFFMKFFAPLRFSLTSASRGPRASPGACPLPAASRLSCCRQTALSCARPCGR